MWDKLKTIITGKFDEKQQAEIQKAVADELQKKEAEQLAYIEKHTKEKYKIIPAFELDGVKYFQFEDSFNITVGRGMVASEYYNEFAMRCSREYLQAYCAAVNNCLNNGKQVELTKLAKLTTQLQERLDLIFDSELLYKLASIVYFDESESPYDYDFKYNLQKIALWKKKSLKDLLSVMPLKELIPLMSLSEADLEEYSSISQKLTKAQLKDISTMLSEKDKKQDFYKTIASLMSSVTDTTK